MSHNSRTEAREFAVQFLYQCESERIFHFSEGHFHVFVSHFQVPEAALAGVREFAQGTLDQITRIDQLLDKVSTNWRLTRMPAVDRNVLRLATYELLESKTPSKVVLNEAIEMAKKYGSAESGAFVNGLLDKLARELRPPKP